MIPDVGTRAPDFDALDQSGTRRRLRDFKGRRLVLYFYPKDMTSGCTREACDFRDAYEGLNNAGIDVVGVSPDSVERHRRFADKEGLQFPLLADPDHAIAEAYGVWVEKSMYGRKYMGIERTTFLIDEKGKIARVWSRVKVPRHVAEVMDAIVD